MSPIGSSAHHYDTPELKIERSVASLIGLLVAATSFALFSLAIGQHWVELRRHGPLTTFTGWFSFAFFLLAVFVILYRLAFGPKFPVHLRSTGILDSRYLRSEIAWTDVTGVSVAPIHRAGSHLLLELSPTGFQKLDRYWGNWFFGRLGRMKQSKGVYIPTVDLKISPSQLETEIRRFLLAKNPGAL